MLFMPPTKTENLLFQKTFKLTLLEKEKQVKTKPNVKCWQKP